MRPLTPQFFEQPSVKLARNLLGKLLINLSHLEKVPKISDLSNLVHHKKLQVGMINEVEVYEQHDPAAHSFSGPTPRNQATFAEAGTLYVYQIYGIHQCLCIVSDSVGVGGAILLRGVIPLAGLDLMKKRRQIGNPPLLEILSQGSSGHLLDYLRINTKTPVRLYKALSGGPGKLTQAFAIDKKKGLKGLKALNGTHLLKNSSIRLESLPNLALEESEIRQTPRIGISKSKEALLRWVIPTEHWVPLAVKAYEGLSTSWGFPLKK